MYSSKVTRFDKNQTNLTDIIAQLTAQSGVAYIKKGEFATNFNYTTIDPSDRLDTHLYLILVDGLKDVNFSTITYKKNDLIYWSNNQWNLLANTTSDFQTEATTGKPKHRGIDLIRGIGNNDIIAGATCNIPGFMLNGYLQIPTTNTNNTITITGTSAYAYSDKSKTSVLVVENQKATAVTLAFATTIWGSSVNVLPSSTDLIVPAGQKAMFLLSKSFYIITIERIGQKQLSVHPFSFTSANQTAGTYNIPIAHNLNSNYVTAILYDKDNYLLPQIAYKRIDANNGQFENSQNFEGTLTGFIIAYYSKLFPFSFTSANQTPGTYNVPIAHNLNSNNVNAVLYDKDNYLLPQVAYKRIDANNGQFENSQDFEGTLTGFISLFQ